MCVFLVDLRLEAVDAVKSRPSALTATITWCCVSDVLLLEVAIGNVVIAPVGYRVELQAVGELHLVGLAQLLELLPSLPLPLALPRFVR